MQTITLFYSWNTEAEGEGYEVQSATGIRTHANGFECSKCTDDLNQILATHDDNY